MFSKNPIFKETGLSDQNVKTCRNQVSTFFIYIRFLLLQALLINENLILERTVPSVFVWFWPFYALLREFEENLSIKEALVTNMD